MRCPRGGATGDAERASVLEAQNDLGVVVEDLVDVLGRQADLADVVEVGDRLDQVAR